MTDDAYEYRSVTRATPFFCFSYSLQRLHGYILRDFQARNYTKRAGKARYTNNFYDLQLLSDYTVPKDHFMSEAEWRALGIC